MSFTEKLIAGWASTIAVMARWALKQSEKRVKVRRRIAFSLHALPGQNDPLNGRELPTEEGVPDRIPFFGRRGVRVLSRRWLHVPIGILLGTPIVAFGATIILWNLQPFADPSGAVATFNRAGNIDESKTTFFKDLGTNGRTCGTCHVPSQAFSFSAAYAQARFSASAGADPLFASVDGANCPTGVTGDPASHSLILNNGLIRVSLPVPTTAEFTLSVVSDPYGCALVTDPSTGVQNVSVYRRPLPATNLNFLSDVMVDGRETVEPLNDAQTFQANLITDLKHQALDATMGHAQASTPPSDAQLSSIVGFEMGLSSAQIFDDAATFLFLPPVQGGPAYLAAQKYYPGINDSQGGDPTGAAFNPVVFTLYNRWQGSSRASHAAVAAGQQVFNQVTCTRCHDAPNSGNRSLPLAADVGSSHAAAFETNAAISGALAELSAPNLPIFEITGCTDSNGNPETFYTSDPGKALISGKCTDVNKTKVPVLRGLAARAPYFHNGSAASLNEVVNFYNDRFQMGLTDDEKSDLVAFLNSL